MSLNKFEEAAADLQNIFTNIDPNLTEAYILYGHCKFLLKNYDAAQEAYIKAIRMSNLQKKEIKD